MKRRYELKQRAETMEETRRRIAKATFELHGILGPAYTTISAVADRAGVERATVYRHFPDDLALFRACVAHGWTEYPGPDPGEWAAIADPERRLPRGLTDLYAYYRRTEWAWPRILRDLPELPALLQANAEAGTFDYFAAVGDTLARGWPSRGPHRRLVRAAIGHAIDFHTWHSLTQQGLDDEEAVQAMVAMVRCFTRAGTRSRTGARGRSRSSR